MIAQHFAIDYPDLVDKLVLAVTVGKKNIHELTDMSVIEIKKYINDLNLTEKEVTVEVIEEATKGILGIGGKPATIKVTPINNVNIDEVKETKCSICGNKTSYKTNKNLYFNKYFVEI